MATIVKMKHKETGMLKDGYFGFSWTTLFFGFIPALFRSDFITFLGGFIFGVLIFAALNVLGLSLAALIWAFMYNKYYTTKLLEKGYVFCDTPEVNSQAAAALGIAMTSPSVSNPNVSSNSEVPYSQKPENQQDVIQTPPINNDSNILSNTDIENDSDAVKIKRKLMHVFFAIVFIIALGVLLAKKDKTTNSTGSEVNKKSEATTVKEETVTSGGILSTSRAYNVSNINTAFIKIIDDVYDLAKSYPASRTICLNSYVQGNDKYGNSQKIELGTLVMDEEDLINLRKYASKSYLNKSEGLALEFSSVGWFLEGSHNTPYCQGACEIYNKKCPTENQITSVESTPTQEPVTQQTDTDTDTDTDTQQVSPEPQPQVNPVAEENPASKPNATEQATTESPSPAAVPDKSRTAKDVLAELPCDDLWKMRNQVFYDKGYCFPKDAGKNIFSNEGCKYEKASEIPLSESEKEHVRMLREIEENKGCVKRTEVTLGNSAANADSNEQYVQNMLDGSVKNDAGIITDNKNTLENQAKTEKGNRKAARKLNEEGLTLFNKGDLTEAVKLFKDANQMDKSDPEVLNNLGYALIKQGNVESAKTAIVDALVISPERYQAWQNFGDILAIQGDMQKAVAAYENVYRFSRNRVHTHKSMHYLNSNNDGGSALKDARQLAMDWAEKTFADENLAQAIQAQ